MTIENIYWNNYVHKIIMILIFLMKNNYKDHLSHCYKLFLILDNVTDTLDGKKKFQRNAIYFNCYFSSYNVDRSH